MTGIGVFIVVGYTLPLVGVVALCSLAIPTRRWKLIIGVPALAGVAWLAYARRVSLVVLIAFLAGSLVTIYAFQWDIVFQLDSGPTWFVAGLLLADRRLLPDSWALRPLLGFVAGLFAIGLRRNGYGIEAAYLTVATIQAVMAVVVILYWAASVALDRWKRTRRLRQREANLRVVKTISGSS